MLSGYKTYIACIVTVVTALGAWLSGDMQLGDFLQTASTAVIGGFLRSGIATK